MLECQLCDFKGKRGSLSFFAGIFLCKRCFEHLTILQSILNYRKIDPSFFDSRFPKQLQERDDLFGLWNHAKNTGFFLDADELALIKM